VTSKTFNTGTLTLITKYGYNTNGQLTALTGKSMGSVSLIFNWLVLTNNQFNLTPLI